MEIFIADFSFEKQILEEIRDKELLLLILLLLLLLILLLLLLLAQMVVDNSWWSPQDILFL
jgi:hypothetical protein